MTDENSAVSVSPQALRVWGDIFAKVQKTKVPDSVNNQEVPIIALAEKKPEVKVITRRLVPVENRAASVQQTETVKHQPKEGFVMVKDPWVKMLMFLVIGLVAMTAIDWHRDWSADQRNNRELADAESEKKIADIKASAPSFEKKVTPLAPVIGSSGLVYNCNSDESVQSGFRQGVIHSISEVSGTPIVGCILLSIGSYGDKPVIFSGVNYRVELPVDTESSSYADSLKYFFCEDSRCANFLQEARSRKVYQNKAVRVLTKNDGYVTITQTD